MWQMKPFRPLGFPLLNLSPEGEQGTLGNRGNPEEDIIVMELDDEYVPKRPATEAVPAEKLSPPNSRKRKETVVPDNVNAEEETGKKMLHTHQMRRKPRWMNSTEGEHDGRMGNNNRRRSGRNLKAAASLVMLSPLTLTRPTKKLTAGTDVFVTEVSGEPVRGPTRKLPLSQTRSRALSRREAEAERPRKQMEELVFEAEAEKPTLEENWQKVVDQIERTLCVSRKRWRRKPLNRSKQKRTVRDREPADGTGERTSRTRARSRTCDKD